MPLYKIAWSAPQRGWALWQITESEEVLAAMAAPEVCPESIIAPLRRLEWLGGRVLIKWLAEQSGLSYQGLIKDEYGKPSLDQHEHHISLSHSFPFVAAQIDQIHVGIDIEQPRPKLLRIAPRVFNPQEEKDAGADLVKNCIYWCAKEALYKIHGVGGISFADNLSIGSFTLAKSGVLNGSMLLEKDTLNFRLAYCVEKEYVLVYTLTH